MGKTETQIKKDWPEEGYEDLAGLPEPAPGFVRECCAAKDKGHGLLYVSLHGSRLRYVFELDQFCFYKPFRGEWPEQAGWHLDQSGLKAEELVEMVALVYLREAGIVQQEIKALGEADADDAATAKKRKALARLRKELFKAVDRLRTEIGLRATLRFARPKIAMSLNDFDANPNLLVTWNATLMLGHGAKARPSQQEDHCMNVAPVEWKGVDYVDPFLDKISLEIHNDNQSLDDYFWRWMGRAIVGDGRPHEILELYGPRGRNGKDVLTGAIQHALGDYATTVKPQLLMEPRFARDASAPDPATLDLKGKRPVFSSESGGKEWLGATAKRLSGGGVQVGRGILGKINVRFEPSHHLVLLTNKRPRIAPSDAALWSRIRLIEYRRRFIANGNPDPNLNEFPADEGLLDKLKERGSAVLSKLVRGLLYVQQHGNTPPLEVTAAIQAYQLSEDLVRQWLEVKCEMGATYEIPAKPGHNSFKEWFASEISDSYAAPGPKKFSEELGRLLTKKHRENGNVYIGARIKPGFID